MTAPKPILHMICGKAASGKSTLCARLAAADRTIIISEDQWLSALYGDQMTSLKDYVRFSAKLRVALGPHIISLLQAGLSVVMDYPANTLDNRAWIRRLFEDASADHMLHVLDVPDEVCLERLRARNAAGDHPFAASEEQFHQLSKHYVTPTADEGFALTIHRPGD